MRLAAFLLAVLVAFSASLPGGGHAHAALEAQIASDQAEAIAGKAHAQADAHAVPCDDRGNDQGGQDSCCISASCGVCAPVPLASFAFIPQGIPAASVSGSASLPRDPPTLRRPPKLSVTA